MINNKHQNTPAFTFIILVDDRLCDCPKIIIIIITPGPLKGKHRVSRAKDHDPSIPLPRLQFLLLFIHAADFGNLIMISLFIFKYQTPQITLTLFNVCKHQKALNKSAQTPSLVDAPKDLCAALA